MNFRTNLMGIIAITLFAKLAIPTPMVAQEQQRNQSNQIVAKEQQRNKINQVRYTVTDLGTLGGTVSFANGVNSQGLVSGGSSLPGDDVFHTFVWQNGVMTDIGTLGGTNSQGLYMDERGQVAGESELTADIATHAFRWTDGVMLDLGTLGGAISVGGGISPLGHVVGTSDTTISSGGNPTFCFDSNRCHAFLWKHGAMSDLGTLPGGANSFAANADEFDRVVGMSDKSTVPDPVLGFPPFRATIWVNGVPSDIGTFGGRLSIAFQGTPGQQGQGTGGRANETVVGGADFSGDTRVHAFLWNNGVIHDLGALPGDPDSEALGINAQGQVIGFSGEFSVGNFPSSGISAVLWQNGTITDLNTLIPADSGLHLLAPCAIDQVGHIAGYAVEDYASGDSSLARVEGNYSGEIHAFLLTPCTGDHRNAKGCRGGSARTATAQDETIQTRTGTLSDNARKLLERQLNSRFHIPARQSPTQ